MEEQKNNAAMGVAKGDSNAKNGPQQKLSYEQLNKICGELYQQNQELIKQVRQSNMSNMFRRLDYLFMVLQFENVIKDPEFINSCVEEIKSALTIPEEKDEGKEE